MEFQTRPCGAHSKNGLAPSSVSPCWCIPEVSPSFVAAMEDVLDLYAELYDPAACYLEQVGRSAVAPWRDRGAE